MAETNNKSSKTRLVAVSRYHPDSIDWNDEKKEPILDHISERNDNLDVYNHPRYRRFMILKELDSRRKKKKKNDDDDDATIDFEIPSEPAANLNIYNKVHSTRLIDFLTTAWKQWGDLGEGGQDPNCNIGGGEGGGSHALIPGNVPLPRDNSSHQRPSKNVMGQIGFFCTDTCTPVFGALLEELLWDAAVVEHAVKAALKQQQPQQQDSSSSAVNSIAYALATHPGHHSAHDSFGGYCYVNHAALAVKLIQNQLTSSTSNKVAVLDVDYHCGNGTASIFYEDPSVLMISIHCHPDCEYPFHSGFYDETGAGDGVGTTLHLPLMPGTTWETYQKDLKRAMEQVQAFGANALVVSLGLDTLSGDPCAVRRAGFNLEGQDYVRMGQMIASSNLPTVVIQEGGYKMDAVPQAAADVLLGICSNKNDDDDDAAAKTNS